MLPSTKKVASALLSIVLVLTLLIGFLPSNAQAAVIGASTVKITTTPTGYTSANDVEYVKNGKYIYNWGARGETCTFLSSYAISYYSDSYSFDTLKGYYGGTGTSDAYKSDLYKALQTLMKSTHSTLTSYDGTKPLYRYTECVSSDTNNMSTFYTGTMVGNEWVSGGTTWNREHIWPRSKCLDTTKKNDSADIMLLRPENPSDNTSRGNKAYGLSSTTLYFDPGVSVRGDCARMLLYGYVRWGNTSNMWGSSLSLIHI